MAYLNVKDRIIETKIVYYGAGLSGKTTNLEMVKKLSTDGKAGDMMTLDTDGDRTLFFDWLPYNIGKFNGCDVKMQLYTVPGQAKYAETRRRVLASADGVVLVLDSQSGALDRNKQTLADLRDHMSSNKMSWGVVPLVIQLNKRDLPTAMDPKELMQAMGLSDMAFVPAVAAKGEGVFETLREAAKLVLNHVRDAAKERSPEIRSGSASELDGKTLYAQITDGAPLPGTAAPAVQPAAAAPKPAAPAVVTAHSTARTLAASVSASAPHVAVSVNGTSATVARRDDVGGSGAQLYELIAAQRTLLRRLDAMEQSVQQSVTSNVAEMERRILARLVGEHGALAGLGEKLAESLTQQGNTQLGMEQLKGEIAQHVTSLAKKLETDSAKHEATIAKRIEAEITKLDAALGKRLDAALAKADGAGQEATKRVEAAIALAIEGLGSRIAGYQIAFEGKLSGQQSALEGKIEKRAVATDALVRTTSEESAARLKAFETKFASFLEAFDKLVEEARESKKPWWR